MTIQFKHRGVDILYEPGFDGNIQIAIGAPGGIAVTTIPFADVRRLVFASLASAPATVAVPGTRPFGDTRVPAPLEVPFDALKALVAESYRQGVDDRFVAETDDEVLRRFGLRS